MADIELVIKIPKRVYNYICKYEHIANSDVLDIKDAIINGTPLPKGHGKIIDIVKIDEDRIEKDNPVIYLQINGECIEAISLDYLNGLPTIIDSDKAESEENK